MTFSAACSVRVRCAGRCLLWPYASQFRCVTDRQPHCVACCSCSRHTADPPPTACWILPSSVSSIRQAPWLREPAFSCQKVSSSACTGSSSAGMSSGLGRKTFPLFTPSIDAAPAAGLPVSTGVGGHIGGISFLIDLLEEVVLLIARRVFSCNGFSVATGFQLQLGIRSNGFSVVTSVDAGFGAASTAGQCGFSGIDG